MTSKSSNQAQEDKDLTPFCDKHKEERLKFYCTDDHVAVCRDCILTKHNKHNCVDIADEAETHREKIKCAFNNLSKNISLFENAESEVSKQLEDTNEDVNKTVTVIEQQESDIIEEVKRTSAQLIAEAKDHAAAQIKSLEAEKDRVQQQKESIHSICEDAKKLVQHCSHVDVIKCSKNIQAKMKEFKNAKPTVQAKTTEITFCKEKLPADFFGRVKKLEWLKTASLVREFHSSMNNLFDLSCSQSGAVYVVCDTSKKLQAISPFHEVKFEVHVPDPRGVTVLSDDRLVVTCDDGCRVYSSSGKHVKTFGQGDMSTPQGVTVDNNGHILVCDQNNKCICVYDAVEYSFIDKISVPMCKYPHYITVLPCDTIVVSDWSGHCVYGVTPQSDVMFQYGTPGEKGLGDGYLKNPWGVCTDSVGHIFIADLGNNRVVVLNSDGQLLRYVVGREQVSIPQGVTIDNKGQLVVGELKGKLKTFRFVQ
ncbi:tripartite motif-containing protein 3-like [Lingula anatina]|uniref:Tripartite motif-containing protein 3-like n=1 Tax=Lingula anatina TaxID=7574 RepID=A0A1S3I9D0_LINAN|nr:tripartite motif-containing protein 3-like [Lingula anatina]|eukprot:XP_013394798.1 tripartite motif-containing protein 3-like [Lingula anatina]